MMSEQTDLTTDRVALDGENPSRRRFMIPWSSLRRAVTLSAWTPIGLGLLLATPILTISASLQRHETLHLRSMVRQEATGLRSRIRDRVETHTMALERIAARQEMRLQQYGWFSRDGLEPAGRLLIADYPELQSIVLLDRWHRAQFTVPESRRPEVASPFGGLDPRLLPALETARRTKQATFVRLVDETAPAEDTFAIACPVFLGLEFRGTVLGILRSPELLAQILTSRAAFGFVAGVFNDTQPVHSPFEDFSALPSSTDYELEQNLGMPAAGWKLVVRPTPDLVRDQTTLVPVQILVIGLVCASLLAAAIRHHQVVTLHGQESSTNQDTTALEVPLRPLAVVPDPSQAESDATVELGPMSRLSQELRDKLDESRREVLQARAGSEPSPSDSSKIA